LRTDDFLGSTIFVVDAETGDFLWQPDLSDSDFTKMKYSIPSDIRIIDIKSDGLADQLYVGDLGGQVWRLDINNSSASTDSIDSRIRGGVVADFGGAAGEANRRRFFYPPDLAVVSVAGTQKLSVSIGSGWRAHPLDVTVQDRFYNFRMSAVYGPPLDANGAIEYSSITESTDGMVDVTTTLNSDPTTNIGWYFDLQSSGEKVLASSLTYNNQVVFTSYIPASASNSCSAAVGSGRVYAVDVLNGNPVSDLDDGGSDPDETLTLSDRYDDLNHNGIPPGPTILFPETGDPVLLLGPEVRDEVDIANPKKRTFWVEHVDSD
ncbi:MAG: pilus assembly protein PilY, partial [Gammaproteobacteria bacterium]|nr:pilus assembly protein PilY [Gammaproteobacteria bacterium]